MLLPAPVSPTSATVSPGASSRSSSVEHEPGAGRVGEPRRAEGEPNVVRGDGATMAAAGADLVPARSSSARIPLGDGDPVGARVELRSKLAKR